MPTATLTPPSETVEPKVKPSFYFDKFEHRTPPKPLPHSPVQEGIWQFLATLAVVFGGWYIAWRWNASLNYDALWFALPLVIAETGAYIGLVLFTYNLWKVEDYPQAPPPQYIDECLNQPSDPDVLISVDVFFPSYDEDPELVRKSVKDAKNISYPHPIDIRIHILDDGKRESMKTLAEEEGVQYITRTNNIGFKAGNMRNAMEVTSGDFIVICDADTRPFPTILEHTLGYFRDPDVAWVQTPQWFFDLPEGTALPQSLKRYLGRPGYWLGKGIEYCLGPIQVGKDILSSDPQMFYDIIQRRRNAANASFCCGAGSIHRREAVMQVALINFGAEINRHVDQVTVGISDPELKATLSQAVTKEMALEIEITPYKFHVSEDIYTSIALHSDQDRRWKSVLHPQVESKMLSPQDLQTWTVQQFKYAGGTLDILFHDNPLFRKGLSFSQKIMYATTFWSFLGGIWNFIFLIAPIVFLFTGVPPVSAYSGEFFKHIIPFLLCNELAFLIGTLGSNTWVGKSTYLAFFPLNLRALWTVGRGKLIKFPTTPKERQEGNFFHIIIPQFSILALTGLAIIFAWSQWAWTGEGNLNALISNTLWGLVNMLAMNRMVRAAFWNPDSD